MTTAYALQKPLNFLALGRSNPPAMYVESLMQIGLTENEASIYLMLLRIGPSPASLIAKRVGMKRVTAYSVLDSLCERGVVTFEQTKTGRRYIPHDPECLLYGVEKQYSEVKFRMKLAKSCVIKLQNVEGSFGSPKKRIIFHHGEESIQKLLRERLNGDESLCVINLSCKNTPSSFVNNFLRDFSEKNPGRTNICVPAECLEAAKKRFKHSHVVSMDASPAANGDLFIQGDRMIFIFNTGDEVQAMQLDDTFYALFVRSVLLIPHFKKELR